ncbi:uncharacterized protein LOC111194234 isoform X1 [Astyanax mexicanus]|uniref:uncharacterized protein LOC111194234 isoform X1 n=2 Tax=Astyanax mexicanus TaxID=7994 RepID=UPI0020CB5736|nr:uncharacterized protein LOC111194234 isoform X1 [Astyanax mexicanus]
MLYLTHVALLLLFGIKGAASRKTAETPEVIKARLGEALTLDCSYNCSSGFVRGYWKWEEEEAPACERCHWENKPNKSEDMCTLSLYTHNLTLQQTLYNYSCITEQSDDQDLPLKTERLISLQIQEVSMKVVIHTNAENNPVEVVSSHSIQVPVGAYLELKCLSTDKHCEGMWIKDQDQPDIRPPANSDPLLWEKITEEDGGSYTCHTKQLCTSQRITVEIGIIKDDDFGWTRALAAVAVSAVMMLMIMLIYLCYKRMCSLSDPEESSDAIYENTRTKNAMTVLKPIIQECETDHEVPYADIVISVRGSSIPELTGTHGTQAPRDHRLRWREEAAGGSRLQACRSADRLHVHPREVSRKLSTTSEYAIITYSTEALS